MTTDQNITEEKQEMANAMLSKNPNSAMQDMMSRIDELRDIYIRETEVLESTDSSAFLALQEEKLTAAQNYQNGIVQLLERKEEMRKADPALKQKLTDMQQDFSDLAKKNSKALERMKRCTDRLGDTIRKAAKDAVQKQRALNYTEVGHMQNTEKKSITTGLNETA